MEIHDICDLRKRANAIAIDNVATGEAIKAACRMRGWTISSLSEILSFTSAQAVYNWLEGKSKPTLDNLVKIAYLLEISLMELIRLK